MASVNPPPLKIPKAFLKDAEVTGAYSALLTVVRQLWARTGGTDDAIEGSITFTSVSDGTNSVLLQRIDELERRLVQMTALINGFQPILDAQARREQPINFPEDAIKLAIVKHG